jgi:hypothetical protein
MLNQIQRHLAQYDPSIVVTQLDNSGLYEIKIPQKDGGTPDITSLMQRAMPEAEPFSGLGFENNCFRQSFLIHEVKTRTPLTNNHLWGITLLLKQESKNLRIQGKEVKDYEFEDLERIAFQIINRLDDSGLSAWVKEKIPSAQSQENVLQYAEDKFKAFSQGKTWGEIHKQLDG